MSLLKFTAESRSEQVSEPVNLPSSLITRSLRFAYSRVENWLKLQPGQMKIKAAHDSFGMTAAVSLLPTGDLSKEC